MPNLSKFRKATLTIDGQAVDLRVARLSLEAAEAYRATLRGLLTMTGDRVLAGEDAAFVRTSIETYLSVAPGALTVDDEPVTTGAELLAIIGENPGLVFRALLAISSTTQVSDDEGKPFASESVSVPSSDGHDQAPAGPTPAPIVADAAPEGSVGIGDATEGTAPPSSGPMETLN